MKVRAMSGLLGLGCLGVAVAQDNAGVGQARVGQIETLKATTRNVILDVVVTDRQGRPARDLTANDFVVREDKEVQAAHLVSIPERSESALPESSGDAPRGGSKQALGVTRSRNVVLLDEMNVSFLNLALARQRLARFFLQPSLKGQSFALLTMSQTRVKLVRDFTSDGNDLARAVEGLPAELPIGAADGYVDQDRALENLRRSIGVVETIAHAYAGSSDHINLFWITSGFPSLSLISTSGDIQFSYEQVMQHASNLYLNARMTIYTIDSSGVQFVDSLPYHVQPDSVSPAGGAFLRGGGSGLNTGDQFAAQVDQMTSNQAVTNSLLGDMDARTGGRGYSNQNYVDVALDAALADGNNVYTFAYSPTNKDFDGKFRRLSVELKRPGLVARTREGYFAMEQNRDVDRPVQRAQIESALDNPILYRALNVTGELVRVNQQLMLRVHVGAAEAEWQYDGTGAHLTQMIALAAYSHANKPLMSKQWTVRVSRQDNEKDKDLVYSLPVQSFEAGSRLRLAVMDDGGLRVGTAEVANETATTH